MRDLWLDSTMLVRLTQSELTSDFGVESSRPEADQHDAGAAGIPTGVGYLVTAPSVVDVLRRAQDDDGDVLAAVDADGGAGHAALLRVLRQAERLDADQLRGRRTAARRRRPAPPATTPRGSASRRSRRPSPSSTRRTSSASTPTYGSARYEQAAGRHQLRQHRPQSRAAPTDRRLQALGRVAREHRRHAERAPEVPVPAARLGPQPELHEQRLQRAADDGPVLLQGVRRRRTSTRTWSSSTSTGTRWRCSPSASARRGGRPTTRTSTTAATRTRRQQYDLTVTYGNADKFLLTGIANWGEVKFDQAYRNTASRREPDARAVRRRRRRSTGAPTTRRRTGWSR